MYILLFSLIFLGVFVITSTIELSSDFKYYKSVYKTLDVENFNHAFNKKYNQIHSKDYSITWFANKDTFLLSEREGVYLRNNFFTYLSPYSCYWYFKYKRWFNKNCSHLKFN